MFSQSIIKSTKINPIKTTSIQFASDLHLEYYCTKDYKFNKFIKPKAETLALLGDIGNPFKETYKIFLEDCSKNFKHVLVISGNHEYYCTSSSVCINSVNSIINSICNSFSNVHFLNNKIYKMPDNNIIFLGTTLWSKILDSEKQLIKSNLNDLFRIHNNGNLITIDELNGLHENNVTWLTKELSAMNQNNKIIVLSHHLPSYKAIQPNYFDLGYNSAFATDLEFLIKKYNIYAWLFGHTHSYVNVKVGSTVLRANPMGYKKNSEDYENEFYCLDEIIKIEE